MTKTPNQISVIRADLEKMEGEFAKVLPPNITPERFIRVVMTALQKDNSLLGADRKSLFSACLQCATDKLIPDGREAALVIFKTKKHGPMVQYMPMVQGILKKLFFSHEVAMIQSAIVHKNDHFRVYTDTEGQHIEHAPEYFSDRGPAIGVYAFAKLKNGSISIEVLNRDQVNAVKASSRAERGPWAGPFEFEMWRKTAIRRLAKSLPVHEKTAEIINRDDSMYDLEAPVKPNKIKSIQNKLNGQPLIEQKAEEPNEQGKEPESLQGEAYEPTGEHNDWEPVLED